MVAEWQSSNGAAAEGCGERGGDGNINAEWRGERRRCAGAWWWIYRSCFTNGSTFFTGTFFPNAEHSPLSQLSTIDVSSIFRSSYLLTNRSQFFLRLFIETSDCRDCNQFLPITHLSRCKYI
ncbi:hypothetical protein SETIT_1G369200v2 [Setaria italica]|uniref:Uncharacterized protein n=1 Tax=Setaria italica TaxID=4555 RepID=A0A368PT54_SETIT|nr:hypothetical protein SETIT_1G369200v2 [Setaria italica]